MKCEDTNAPLPTITSTHRYCRTTHHTELGDDRTSLAERQRLWEIKIRGR